MIKNVKRWTDPSARYLLFFLTFYFTQAWGKETESYGSGFEPITEIKFSKTYKDYQVLPLSISPNRNYALIYPKRSLLYKFLKPELFLVIIQPFKVLVEVPLGNSNLAANAHGYYVVNWAKNSSSILVIEGLKWGPEKIFLISLKNGKADKITDLSSEIKKQVTPNFNKSKAEHYNEYSDFIFLSGNRILTNRQSEVIGERGWDINDNNQVVIDCTCTNDPKGLSEKAWTINFKGVWDIARECFINQRIESLVSGSFKKQ